jgi:hypothetical protein
MRAWGGIFREEAILMLRKFYIQQNVNGKSDGFQTLVKWLNNRQRRSPSQRRIANSTQKSNL